ncbi:MAG TPA: sulfur oxidation c-type cytochrome SoxX [Rhodobacteraceae bacterium]|nr:sulfur oxidation c-type cytochrome SoxX [Paracoccaceae bacterium]
MKPAVLGMAVLFAATTALSAAEIAPGDVVFDEGAVATSLTGVPGDPANGRMVVASKKHGNCMACHTNDEMPDVGFQGDIAPNLAGVAGRYSEAQLRGILVNADITFEDSFMPSFYRVDGYIRPGKRYTGKAADDTFGPLLSAQEVEDVLAYLLTLK